MHEVDTGHHLEQFTSNMVSGTAAGRRHVDLTWIGLSVGNELGNRLDWHRGVHLDGKGLASNARDRRDVADEIEIELVVECAVDRVHESGHKERISVRGRVHDHLGADIAGSSWSVLTAHKYVRSASNGENNNRGVKTTKERPEMRSFIRIVALAVALVIPGSAFAQQYPSKPVKIIVPFPPAGVTDIVGRLVAQKLSEKLGEQFYIENIAGAGGNLGMGQAARSPGDGYTILFASSSIVVNPTLYSKVPFDIDKDFVPVT